MSHSYVIELIVPQNSNFAKLFCVFFIIFSFFLSFSYKNCTFTRFSMHFALLFLSYFYNFYVLFFVYTTQYHYSYCIFPFACWSLCNFHNNKKEHSTKYLIYEMFFFIFNSNPQSYRSHLSQHLCFCDHLTSFVYNLVLPASLLLHWSPRMVPLH